ncbi:MAG: sensor histidine kinase, partial [Anaerolineales bacterium]
HFTYPTEMDLNLSSLAEVQLICIIREALINVRKHSQAKRVDIQIKKINKGNAQYINLLIHDDGKGFIEKESKRSFGLQTMRERAQSVHGSLNITSVPGKGTTLICNLPCLANEYKVNKPIFPQISEIKG